MTIKDIAKACGVSVSTVSRVLNDHPDVSQSVRDRVRSTVEPDPELTARYEKRYAEFRQIYPACKALFPNLL